MASMAGREQILGGGEMINTNWYTETHRGARFIGGSPMSRLCKLISPTSGQADS